MGKIAFLLLVGVFWCTLAWAQRTETDSIPQRRPEPTNVIGVDDDEVYKVVETMPEFPGGQSALMQYIGKINYPAYARENNLEGTVYIQFVVSKDGAVEGAIVARSSGSKLLDSISVAHISAMPKWSPGTQSGKPVRVQYVVPIKFKLGGDAIYNTVSDMPDFPGGEKALEQYLLHAPAPEGFGKKQLSGMYTYIQAVVNENGELINIGIAKTCGNEELDYLAWGHIKTMPKWNPGTQNGQKVKVRFTFKVGFVPTK